MSPGALEVGSDSSRHGSTACNLPSLASYHYCCYYYYYYYDYYYYHYYYYYIGFSRFSGQNVKNRLVPAVAAANLEAS